MNISFLLLFLKIFFLVFLGYLLYALTYKNKLKLSRFRYEKYYFPKQYKIEDFSEFLKSIFALFIYVSIFIFGFLFLRFLGSNRSFDLKLLKKNLTYIFVHTPTIDLILNIFILILFFLLYIILFKKLMRWIKLHRVRLHIFLKTRTDWYENFFYGLGNYDLSTFIRKICHTYSYILYFFKIKKIPISYADLDYDITNRNFGIFEDIFISYLYSSYKKIHYYLLVVVLFYDLFFNDFVLCHIYKILLYIYI